MSISKTVECTYTTKSVMRTHFHTDYELLFVISGKITLKSNNLEYILSSEDFFLINTGCEHSWFSEGSCLIGSLMINSDDIRALFNNSPVMFDCYSVNCTDSACEQIRKLIKQLLSYERAADGQGRILYNTLSYQLLYQLTSEFQAQKNDPVWNIPTKGQDKRTYDILQYMNQNYNQHISLSSLAEQMNLSTPYLSKFFKTKFGMTFISYLQKIRLEHAANDIVNTEKSLTHIALDNGFPNSASFISKFKEVYDVTPSEYRRSLENRFPEGNSTINNNETPAGISEENAASSNDINSRVLAYLSSQNIPPVLTRDSSVENVTVIKKSHSIKQNPQFHKPWMKLLNVGNSSNLLRYDVREQIQFLRKELNFEYLYINNLLHPSMKIHLDSSSGKYNFSEIRKALDFIVSIGMHPYIELESQEMDSPRHIDSHLVEASIHSQLEYLYKNYDLFDSLITFLIRRYGQEELSKWYISLERSTAVNNTVSESDYFRYFSGIYEILKSRIPEIKIGGPGFTIDFREDRLNAFMDSWLKYKYTPDFITLYSFPYIMNMDLLKAGRSVTSSDRSYLANILTNMNHCLKRIGMEDTEVHVTLFNSSLSNRNVLNDGCYKSSYLMSNMLESWDKCSMIGYWNATDLSVLDSDTETPLFGGNGLTSQNGLKKPAFFAYGFLNRLLPYYLTSTRHCLVTANDNGRFAICCHNYKHFNHLFYQQKEEKIKIEEQHMLFENNDSLILKISISDLPEGEFLIRRRFVSETVGNIQNAWVGLSRLRELNASELSYLDSKSEPGLSYEKMKTVNGTLELEETLDSQEIRLIEVELVYD